MDHYSGRPATPGGREFDDAQDAVFDALAHRRRRSCLQCLLGADTPITVDELMVELSSEEAPSAIAGRSADGADAIESTLVHVHLPKLAAADLVQYDSAAQTVALADRTDQVRAHLEAIPSK